MFRINSDGHSHVSRCHIFPYTGINRFKDTVYLCTQSMTEYVTSENITGKAISV